MCSIYSQMYKQINVDCKQWELPSWAQRVLRGMNFGKKKTKEYLAIQMAYII